MKYIKELKFNSPTPTSVFDIEILDSLKSFAKRIEYCENTLIRISSGSGRIVYKIDDSKVLKLARNPKGVAQIENEVKWGNDYYFEDVLAKVDESSLTNTWLVMELARKVSKSEFKKIIGADVYSVGEYLKCKYFDYIGKKDFCPISNEIKELCQENEFVEKVLDFVMANNNYGDLDRLSTYGIVNRDGEDRIVIIDYGLSNDVYKKHYSGRK